MLGIAVAGGALEFYDFVIFAFLIDVIGVLFFPPGSPSWLTTAQTFGIFATGYIFRPLGGVVLAHFGDLFGRKRVFAFSILLMAVSTLGIGLLPVYQTVGVAAPLMLVVFRVLQGIAIGGEVPGAWTFAAEHVSPGRMGLACGLVCAGLSLGIFLGAGITALMALVLSPATMLSYGWRVPFILGGALGLVGVHLRRMLHETPVFLAMRTRKMLVPELPLGVVVRTHARGVIVSMICTWVLSACVVMLTLMVPTILESSHHFEREVALTATTISAISLGVGAVLGGIIYDRIGAARFFLLGGIFLASGSYAFFSLSTVDPSYVYILSAVIGLSGAISVGAPVVMVSCFPSAVRFSGISFSYNVAYAVLGGLTPVTLAALLTEYPQLHVYYLLFVSALAAGLGIYLAIRPDVLSYRRTDGNAQ